MSKVGLIQPGRLGDIIICLPIAKYLATKGYHVIWPIFSNYKQMIADAVDYVEFIPVTDNVYQTVPSAYQALRQFGSIPMIDIAATFPGSVCTEEYSRLGDGFGPEKFDQFKYRLSDVPFAEKWNLQYKRDLEKEEEVYNLYVKSDIYDVVGLDHSQGRAPFKVESKNQIIELNTKHSIFHWRKILSGAQNIVLVDSAMANFVDQIMIPNDKILIEKPGQPRPVFKNQWRLIK